MSEQDGNSPYNINAISIHTSDENKVKKYQLGDYELIQYQIICTNIRRIVWQLAVRRISNEILRVQGLAYLLLLNKTFLKS